MKGRYDPVDISDNTDGNSAYGFPGVRTWYSQFHVWNHWPISLSESGGRPASFADRASHSSLIRANPQTYAKQTGDATLEMDRVSCKTGPDFRQGVIIDTDGTYTLVIWLDCESTSTSIFEIRAER